MSYPQIVEYNDAIQSPRQTLTDTVLQQGILRTNQLGLPLALSGGFALTYEIAANGKRYAVRCFHVEVPGIEARYAKISQCLRALNSPYFVHFDFQAHGIRVGSRSFPIIKMDWVEGETLGVFIESNFQRPEALINLKESLRSLARYLEVQEIAHGDLQNENIILERSALRLIDYDGMYVPGLPLGQGTEVGHKHFQHPQRTVAQFGPEIDRFSSLSIDLSLRALVEDSGLHKRFSQGGTTIIFRANDLADPASSEVFACLRDIPSLRTDSERFANLCLSPIGSIPTLDDFLAGKGGNEKLVLRPPSAAKKTYIPAFKVVNAASFADVERAIGQRVELVGQIYSVYEGTTRRGGRRGGRPYVFISFNDWRGNSVKLTLWSEALEKMNRRPDQSWVGRWVSVTGLVEPPYYGKAEGISYISVGITIEDAAEIVTVTAVEAQFRLGSVGSNPRPVVGAGSSKTSNRSIVDELRAGTGGSGPRSPQKVATSSRNQQLVSNIKGRSPLSQRAPKLQGSQTKGDKIPWIWIAIVIGILWLLLQ